MSAVPANEQSLLDRIAAAGASVRELKKAKGDFQPALEELLAAKVAGVASPTLAPSKASEAEEVREEFQSGPGRPVPRRARRWLGPRTLHSL